MTVTPAGLPAWTRTADHTVYGGHLQKANYQSQGVVNPRTDMGAEAIARMAADLECIVRTAPFAEITYLNHDASPAAPTIECAYLMTGVRTASYEGGAAPTGFPSAARNGTGDVTFTFAASYADAYGVVAPFTPTNVTFGCHGTTFMDAAWVISGSTVRIRCFGTGGAALGDRRLTIVVT